MEGNLCKGFYLSPVSSFPKMTLLQAIIILANNYCESSYIVPNIFYSFATVVGHAHTPTHSYTLNPFPQHNHRLTLSTVAQLRIPEPNSRKVLIYKCIYSCSCMRRPAKNGRNGEILLTIVTS